MYLKFSISRHHARARKRKRERERERERTRGRGERRERETNKDGMGRKEEGRKILIDSQLCKSKSK